MPLRGVWVLIVLGMNGFPIHTARGMAYLFCSPTGLLKADYTLWNIWNGIWNGILDIKHP